MKNNTLILLVSYLVLVFIVFPTVNRTRVFSTFSSVTPEINSLIEELKTHHRVTYSEAYLKALHPARTREYHENRLASDTVTHLLIMLVQDDKEGSVFRSSRHLLQLAASLDEVVKHNSDTGLLLCDATLNHSPVMNDLSSYFPAYSLRGSLVKAGSLKAINESDRLKRAFVECLHGVNQFSNMTKLVTIFNRNILPYQNFATVVREIVQTKLDFKMHAGELTPNLDKWLFLHLQEPVQLRFYQCDFQSFSELVLVVMTGAVIFLGTFKLLEPNTTSGGVLFIIVYGGIFFLTFAVFLGRPYLSELRRMAPAFYRVYDPPEPIRFSALTLTPWSFRQMEPHLRSTSCSDYVGFYQLLDSLINTLEVPGYVVSPSLVRYV